MPVGKRDNPREPISAKVVADFLHTVGVNGMITLDLQAPANEVVDHLTALHRMTEYLKAKN